MANLPFRFGEVLLHLCTDRCMDVFVECCVARDPNNSRKVRQ